MHTWAINKVVNKINYWRNLSLPRVLEDEKVDVGDITIVDVSTEYNPLAIVKNYDKNRNNPNKIDLMKHVGQPNAKRAKR